MTGGGGGGEGGGDGRSGRTKSQTQVRVLGATWDVCARVNFQNRLRY